MSLGSFGEVGPGGTRRVLEVRKGAARAEIAENPQTHLLITSSMRPSASFAPATFSGNVSPRA